ncbi:MAG: NAD(P)H-hydrate dehydratase [Oscillospiraceae bacterium]|nr:NAD(P)H-hydrate dehydratase [Oscillospiraceae bacterium]
MEKITAAFVRENLPSRDPYGHKGTFGKVLCICGSVGYTGAPVFASRAAVRTGSGLVFLAVPQSIWQVVAVKSDEAMPFPMPDDGAGKLNAACWQQIAARADGCDAVLCGCGLGRSIGLDELVRLALTLPKPLVLDADGINAIATHIDVLQNRRGQVTVLTPHEGEFLRMDGDLTVGRIDAAADFAEKYGVYLVLKGHETVVAAPDGRVMVNTTGNSGMAKGGSGDVLSGMVLSLLGQGMEPFAACCSAVYLHGLAGDLAAAEKGERGMTPTDLLEQIPYALVKTEK